MPGNNHDPVPQNKSLAAKDSDTMAARDAARCEQLLRDHIAMTFEDARNALKETLFQAYSNKNERLMDAAGKTPPGTV